MVCGGFLEAEPLQDLADVGLEGLVAESSRVAMAMLERPSAIRARTSSSRGVSASSGPVAGRRMSRSTMAGSMTHRRNDPAESVENDIEVVDTVFQQVAEVLRGIADQPHRPLALDVLRQHQDADRRWVRRSRCAARMPSSV